MEGAPGYLGRPCIAFEKYDGSNLFFKWTVQNDWHEFGTRRHVLTPDHEYLGAAHGLFMDKYADEITRIMRRHKEYRNLKELLVFCEFFGPKSFAGRHARKDEKDLKLFDIRLPESGFLPPAAFKEHFGELDIARIIFESELTLDFLRDVFLGKYDVSEGIVAKGTLEERGENRVWMGKFKTCAYLEKLQERAAKNPLLETQYAEMIELHLAMVEEQEAGRPIPFRPSEQSPTNT